MLSTEVASRESRGGETLEEFDFTFQRSVKRQVVNHLGQLDFLHGKENVVLLGPPGTGRRTLRSWAGQAGADPDLCLGLSLPPFPRPTWPPTRWRWRRPSDGCAAGSPSCR
jgi:hypothetical protein